MYPLLTSGILIRGVLTLKGRLLPFYRMDTSLGLAPLEAHVCQKSLRRPPTGRSWKHCGYFLEEEQNTSDLQKKHDLQALF